jgi:hypothetical protein
MTKGDFINAAYSRGRISGLTVQPTPEDLDLALNRLENMAAEWDDRNICTGYAFEDTPDVNTLHNVERKYWNAYESCLAMRILTDFGKQPMPTLIAEASTTFSRLSASTAQVRQVNYPSRQPLGSGNTLRRHRYRQFYTPQAQAPISCDTVKMRIGDIDDFVEHYDSYLRDTETVSSYVITSDSGVTVSNDSLTSPDISYRIEAVGGNITSTASAYQVKIVATTSLGRIETRFINFELSSSEL